MKMVHLLAWYFPDAIGGTEIYVDALCRRLQSAGHDVTVAAPVSGDAGRNPRRYVHNGVRVFRYPIEGRVTRDEALHRVPVRGAAALYEWLQVERPDVLHIHSFATGAGLPEVREARRLGIRVIATCHLPGLGFMCRAGELMRRGRELCDGIVDVRKCAECNLTRLRVPEPIAHTVASIPSGISATLGALPGRIGTALGMSASIVEYGSMQRELFHLVDAFVVLNETARRMLIANGSPAAKLVVNRLGVSERREPQRMAENASPAGGPVRFGYLGRIDPAKGLEPIVQAAVRCPADVDFTLDIRGPATNSPARRFLERLQKIAASEPRVRFGGAVEPGDVPDVLRTFDVLVCPSLSFENGPTVALEAHAVGTPVVATAAGNLAEIVADGVNGRLLPPGDIGAWSRALADIAGAPERTIAQWKRHLPTPRTMDDVARDYLSLYEPAA